MSSRDESKACVQYGVRIGTRRGERRADLRQVVRALAEAVASRQDDRTLQLVFEQALSHVVPARSIRMREVPTRYPARLVTPTRTSDSMVVDVPTSEPDRQVVLEASFEPGRLVDEWNVDLLSSAAHLGTLVLQVEGRRGLVGPKLESAAALVGTTTPMRALRERVARVANTDFTVLIEGESGTGKELVARQIHESSWRRRGPFVAVNCAALVETLLEAELFGIEDRTATGVKGRRGKFEHADGGTLFLDEVSDLSATAQAKLLRALQDLTVERVGGVGSRRVDVRIVAATNRPLSTLVVNGQFRSDLYYRLSGVEVHVPPLRARTDDILDLARHFLMRYRHSRALTISDAVADALRAYAWPGNVRELERLIERLVALTAGDRIEIEDLPPAIRGHHGDALAASLEAGESMRAWGSRYARLVYERHGRNKRHTCRALGISYHTLDAYLRYAQPKASGGRKQMPAWVSSSVVPQDPSPAAEAEVEVSS